LIELCEESGEQKRAYGLLKKVKIADKDRTLSGSGGI
jgi:hypothetical protein